MALLHGKSLQSQQGCAHILGLVTSFEGPSTNKYAGYTARYGTFGGTMPKRAATAAIWSSLNLSCSSSVQNGWKNSGDA